MIPKLLATSSLFLMSVTTAAAPTQPAGGQAAPAPAQPAPEPSLERIAAAARQGNAAAQHELGVRYSFGQGVPQDYGTALHWYQQAAAQGYAASQYYMGAMYQHGAGVPKDTAQAMRWYRYAALQGHSGAQANLGELIYMTDRSGSRSEEALRWIRLAVAQGDAHALMLLGLAYKDGRGLPADPVQAHKWLSLAATRTSESEERDNALRLLQQLSLRMTPQEMASAEEMAKAWRPLATQRFLAVP